METEHWAWMIDDPVDWIPSPLKPPKQPPNKLCDWGESNGMCYSPAVAWRYDPQHGWLPVCHRHRALGN